MLNWKRVNCIFFHTKVQLSKTVELAINIFEFDTKFFIFFAMFCFPRKIMIPLDNLMKCFQMIEILLLSAPNHFKHEYLRSRAYICLSLSSPFSSVMVTQLWALSRYSCVYLGSLHPINFRLDRECVNVNVEKLNRYIWNYVLSGMKSENWCGNLNDGDILILGKFWQIGCDYVLRLETFWETNSAFELSTSKSK